MAMFKPDIVKMLERSLLDNFREAVVEGTVKELVKEFEEKVRPILVKELNTITLKHVALFKDISSYDQVTRVHYSKDEEITEFTTRH